MKNFIQEGGVLSLTAPTGGVKSGVPYLIGTLLVVALGAAAEGEQFQGKLSGVFSLPIKSGDTPTEGAKAYWDNTNKNFTTTASGNLLKGAFLSGEQSDGTANIMLIGNVQ